MHDGSATFRERLDRSSKRLLDISVACALGIALLPVSLVVALVIRLDTPGPIFYRCRRTGHRRSEFQMLKFRKMFDAASGSALTARDDQRFTRVGRYLARSKLDEIPQLWNVLRGEMSLVGPRPEDPRFVDACAGFDTVFTVKPGVTGLAQLAFARESEILSRDDPEADYVERILPQKVALDSLYARRRTMAMDLRILWWTMHAVVFRQSVAVDRSSGRARVRRRPAPERRPVAAPVKVKVPQ
jgi:lipopolysaccharide/colanic/teichoic acid biosynthesis glycosyltransferase